MATSQFKPFAAGGGTSIVTQSTYEAAAWRLDGWRSGILPHQQINKVLRQTSVVAAALTQAMADVLAIDILDDGNVLNLSNQFRGFFSVSNLPFDTTATYPAGSAGAMLKSLNNDGAAWLSAVRLKDVLTGSLAETELSLSMRGRLDLIDTPGTGLVAKVAGLESTYGSTLSASQSAIAAASSAITAAAQANAASISAGAAYASETNSNTARAAAQSARTSAETAATNSASSASSAAGNASTASTKASEAAASASAALGSATAATNKASEASTSATNAATYASAASSSATTAATQAGSASTSASSASSSASTAYNAANLATTKADLAAASADQASGSAAAAGISATNAASSSSNATAKASEASTHATNAATSSATAATQAGNAASSATTATSAATTASTAATTAAARAGEASSSANAAAISAASASISATTAATAATTAAGHASAANTQATNAAASAGDAAGSATAAAGWYNSTVSSTGALTAAVTLEAETRSNQIAGVHAQLVFKTVATRGDGRKVLGAIGLASTGPTDATGGQSEILMQADRLVFVPSSDPNAPLKNLLEVGLVDGVSTLRIPGAIIGDLTVGRLKIVDLAVNTQKIEDGSIRAMAGAEVISDTYLSPTTTDVLAVSLDASNSAAWVVARYKLWNTGGLFVTAHVELMLGGAVLAQYFEPLSAGQVLVNSFSKFLASTAPYGSTDYKLRISGFDLSPVVVMGAATTNMVVIGSRR